MLRDCTYNFVSLALRSYAVERAVSCTVNDRWMHAVALVTNIVSVETKKSIDIFTGCLKYTIYTNDTF